MLDSYQSDSNNMPLLALKAEKGTLACRVHIPQYTYLWPNDYGQHKRRKYALLSDEKMTNLALVRGKPEAYMIGPNDYYQDLDCSDKHAYTIKINDKGIPSFIEHPLASINDSSSNSDEPLKKLPKRISVAAKWYCGDGLPNEIKQHYQHDDKPIFSGNLFRSSGILTIDADTDSLTLPSFDAREVDLSEYKARLVANHQPFQITQESLHVDDEYCAISYDFSPGYANHQVKEEGGIFLEQHAFSQTMTPLDESCSGFVSLAKWDVTQSQLDIIALKIPFGYTLIVDKYCIHGDATLSGSYMMCMTSDHISMQSADTVFLKNSNTKNNLNLVNENQSDLIDADKRPSSLKPLAFFDKPNPTLNWKNFKKETTNHKLIFAPLNLAYWQIQFAFMLKTFAIVMTMAVITITLMMLEQPLLLAITIGTLSGVIAYAFDTLLNHELGCVNASLSKKWLSGFC